jgi:hypothetical protein
VLSVLAGALWVEHLTGSTVLDYDEILVGTAAVAALLAAVKLLRDNCFESRLAATVLATLTAFGQLLAATVGRPGDPQAGWHPGGFAVIVLAAAVPVLVALDARARARISEQVHPYAL